MMTVVVLLEASSSAARGLRQNPKGGRVAAPQKRRVVARGHLSGAAAPEQIVTWQTANPSGGTHSYATAHLAIETPGVSPAVLWQTDGSDSQHLVDSVRIADLDGDGTPEIISLWWEGAPAGAKLRVFHWDRERKSFAELQSTDDLGGVHRYQLFRATGRSSVIVVSGGSRIGAASRRYEVMGPKLVRVNGGAVVTAHGESGIEGQAVISPVRPGPIREGQSSSAPYKTTLVVRGVNDGREVARFETGSDGRFRVTLPPGTYTVGPPERAGRFLPRGSEETVRVEPGRFAQVTINFDSGMR